MLSHSILYTVNYAAVLALEIRQSPSGGEPVLRFNFQNGTDSDFQTYNILGKSGDLPISDFVNYLAVGPSSNKISIRIIVLIGHVCPPNQPVAVNTTSDWCNVCQNTQNRGCDEIASAASQDRKST